MQLNAPAELGAKFDHGGGCWSGLLGGIKRLKKLGPRAGTDETTPGIATDSGIET